MGLRLAGSSKLQVPSSKKAPNPKHQNEHLKTCEAANSNQGGGTCFPRRLWALEFGIFLELGTWSLELCQSDIPLKTWRKLVSWPLLLLGLSFWLQAAGTSSAAELTLKVTDKEPPKELDPSIRSRLQAKAIQLLNGDKPAYEFWFSNEVPLPAKPDSPAKALQTIRQATLLGVVSVSSDQRDYRDDELYAGVYTMRFALQPQDGNHLGTSEYNYFAVLIQAKIDTKLDGITDYKPMVKASSKGTTSDHPIILSLRPSATEEGDFPKLNEPAPEHKSVRIKLRTKVAGADQPSNLVFELVYEGKGKK